MPRPFDPTLRHRPNGRYRRVLSCMINQKAKTQLCPETPRLDGKLALVTGGTGGIGAEIVKGLSERGAEVIVAARGGGDTEATLETWARQTGGQIGFLPLDLGDLNAVAQATRTFEDRWHGRQLDIICANAGISPHQHSLSADGFENAFAVNCLGHHLLIRRFIERALLSDQASIVGTTGDIYVLAKDCSSDFSYRGRGLSAYCRSKLGNLWQYTELAERYPDLRVIAVHPGVVATALEGPTDGVTGSIKRAMMLSPELGAQASLIAVTQDQLESGDYFHNKHGRITPSANDPAMAKRNSEDFWHELEQICAPFLADWIEDDRRVMPISVNAERTGT